MKILSGALQPDAGRMWLGDATSMFGDWFTYGAVGLLAPQGDDAMLEEADIPKLTEGCEKAGNLSTDPNTKCILEAKSLEEVDKCGDKAFDGLIKPWLM